MEIHSGHKVIHHSHLGEEKHQMLNLNRRLETYLSRVKLLEEENALLAKEIQALRHSNNGTATRRKGLEEELNQARWEVDAAWKDRVYTELEVSRLTEELQALDFHWQKEARAQVEAKKKLEQSKKELEEEHRAQIWLRQKVSQLEHEKRLLIETHQDNLAHLEAKMTHHRATVPPALAQRAILTPNIQQLEQEYSQRVNRAWQQTAEAYEGQLARLEDSLNETRGRLIQVDQENSESHLKLQALEKEIASAQDVRQHLEKTATQQRDKHIQEMQQFQDHLEGLEAEKDELGQQIDQILLKNRGLLDLQMSLGLEVSTYRVLLDSENFRGDNSLLNQPRNFSITDAVFSPQGPKENYQTQLPSGHNTTSFSSVYGVTGRSKGTPRNAVSVWSRKPVTLNETPKILKKYSDDDTTKSSTWETPYPKILQDGAIENFRPQEVHETVTYAEPLSPPNEQEAPEETIHVDQDVKNNWTNVGVEPPEEKTVESVVSYKVESGLTSNLHINDEIIQHQFTTPNLAPYYGKIPERPGRFLDEPDNGEPYKMSAREQELQQPHAPIDAQVEKECIGKEVIKEHIKEETSDSETEAVLEPTFESRTSSPISEYEPEESVFNQVTDSSRDEKVLKEVAAETRQEISCSTEGTNETDVEYKLYPDGEEMDTWDSVMERKVDLKMDDEIKKDETKQQHAEPEEDISVREEEQKKKDARHFGADVQQDDSTASSLMDKQYVELGKEHSILPDHEEEEEEEEENDEEEDSQNVSVSWKTELESDSYALDNTLADTRPLIRYKSDETDANTQASHMDESESSEGEQEKKVAETGTGAWSEGKSKKFGTMEDLCEETEGEALDDEYELGYTHTDDRDIGQCMTVSGNATPVNDDENTEEMIKKVSEGHLDEETEEFAKPVVPSYVDYDEELDTDRLVEQELENLSTDSYAVHFAQQQEDEEDEDEDEDENEMVLPLQDKFLKEMTEHKDAGETKMEDMSSGTEPDMTANLEQASSTEIISRPYENLYFDEFSVVAPQTNTMADEEVHDKDQEAVDAPEKRGEEDEHNVSMVTHADITEDQSIFNDLISRPDMEEINNPEDQTSMLHLTADQENLQDVAVTTDVKEAAPVDASSVSQEHEVAEWEVLENPSEDFEIRDQNENDGKQDNVLESAESYLHDDGDTDEGAMIYKEESLEISTDSVPDEKDIFLVKDSTEILKTNGKDSSLHGFFSSGVNNDFWVSSLETGATFQPDDAFNEAAEQTNKHLGFDDSLVWGNSEKSNVVNGKFRLDNGSSKALEPKKEQEQKQVLFGNVGGELIQSEESEIEGGSWSSGEE